MQKHVSGQTLLSYEKLRLNQLCSDLVNEANGLPKKLQENAYVRPVLWGALLLLCIAYFATGIVNLPGFLLMLGFGAVLAYVDMDSRHMGFPTIFKGVASHMPSFDVHTPNFVNALQPIEPPVAANARLMAR